MASWRTHQSSLAPRVLAERGTAQRRKELGRQLRMESLEDRRVMAGPQIVGILPDDGHLLQSNETLNVAPLDLTFRFDQNQTLDFSTADGIQIWRSGLDGVFTPASASTDFNTNGLVQVQFRANALGTTQNGLQLVITKTDFGGLAPPNITVAGTTISVELNSNSGNATTAQELVALLNANAIAKNLITASITSGVGATNIASPTINYSPVTLTGANAAKATSDLNTLGGVRIDFFATTAGAAGNGTQIIVNKANLAAGVQPQVTVAGNVITVMLNNTIGSKSTATDLVNAINNSPAAAAVATAVITTGNRTRDVATSVVNGTTITLSGSNDVLITPGFRGKGESDREIITRFQETLPDDVYHIDIFGAGTLALLNDQGEAFQNGTNFSRGFELDLGARIIAIVPQPIDRAVNGATSQRRNQIDIYFNEDDLHPVPVTTGQVSPNPSVVEPHFYKLYRTRDTASNLDDDGPFTPTSVSYDPATDKAILTFASNLDLLPGGIGTYRLRIGTNEDRPAAPTSIRPTATVSSDFNTAGLATLRFDAFTPGEAGDGTRVLVTRANLGPNVPPTITVLGNRVNVVLNNSAGSRTTAQQLIDALASNVAASLLVRASLASGSGAADITTTIPTGLNLTLELPGGLGSSFDTATNVGTLTATNLIYSSAIDPQVYTLSFPGDNLEPGHRNISISSANHVPDSGDDTAGISTVAYNFRSQYGFDPSGNPLFNLITENQKQRTREVLEEISQVAGIQFVETATSGFIVATGDLRAIDCFANAGVGFPYSISGVPHGVTCITPGTQPAVILDNAEFWVDQYGANWFQRSMHEIGSLLGLDNTHDLPPGTIMGQDGPPPTNNPLNNVNSSQTFSTPGLQFDNAVEPVFPGPADVVHWQYLYRPESKDIDLYQFQLDQTGLFSAEVTAERRLESSLLDSALRLWKEIEIKDEGGNVIGIKREVIAQNDDYFSKDSYLRLLLEPGKYWVGVSASGNTSYDPTIEDTGMGGTSQGEYDLRFDFRPQVVSSIVDSTGVAFDGDADGIPGGVYNHWFRVQSTTNTLFVDKRPRLPVSGALGTLTNPYTNLGTALGAAQPGQIVRVLGNGGTDGNLSTLADNEPYLVGFNSLGGPLTDGSTVELPKDVTMMVDAGAIFKMRRAAINVGSTSPSVDRSKGALQILGTPTNNVYFTSYDDANIGRDANPDTILPTTGNWGGLNFRNDIDNADYTRFNYEAQGIFLNYVNHADIRYGGGNVVVASVPQTVNPINMIDARPTVTENIITFSADAAMSANPDSFREDNFHSPPHQRVPFTSDYGRVGPEIHGNRLVDALGNGNAVNGLAIRISTPALSTLETLTVTGRFNDRDIVHVVPENFVIQGTPGGPREKVEQPAVSLVTVVRLAGGGILSAGTYNYRMTFVDSDGNESSPSAATSSATINTNDRVRLNALPTAPAGFTSRLIYRGTLNPATNTYTYVLAARINSTDTQYIDAGATLGGSLDERVRGLRPRLDAGLTIDPAIIVKFNGAGISTTMGGRLTVEAFDGLETVFTSLADDRYGAGGTFLTRNDGVANTTIDPTVPNSPAPGDWSGVFVGPYTSASLDHVVIAFAGGITRVEGSFAGFNALEIHQSEARVAHTIFEFNQNGLGGQAPAGRFGRGFNEVASIFVRGSQPVIVDNILRHNLGPAISINVNSLNFVNVTDTGRQSGLIDIVQPVLDNQGPLVVGNQLDDNAINGMVVRGETVTTETVWDDTDIVHVLLDTVYIYDFHTYGGVRLESSPTHSLIVKLQSQDVAGTNAAIPDFAGFTANGQPLDIDDRIGGIFQVIGQPGKPVVMSSLADDSVGAGFRPDGEAQVDTNNDGISTGSSGGPGPGGGGGTQVVITGTTTDGNALRDNLLGPGVTPVGNATFVGSNVSAGFFTGGSSSIGIETGILLTTGDASEGGGPNKSSSTTGFASGLGDTDLDTTFGVTTEDTTYLEFDFTTTTGDLYFNFVFASDEYNEFANSIFNDVFAFYVNGNNIAFIPGTATPISINTINGGNPLGTNPVNPGFYNNNEIFDNGLFLNEVEYDGFTDVFTATALGLGPGTHTIKLALSDVGDSSLDSAVFFQFGSFSDTNRAARPQPGDWSGALIDQYASDRNVETITESEPATTAPPGLNGNPTNAQFLGDLGPREKAGDENRRLGFTILGAIGAPADVDVYSFTADAGTEVWMDIDRTKQSLDSVVELIDANGKILAQSDNSGAESASGAALYTSVADNIQAFTMQKQPPYLGLDRWTVNPRDAGMRVVLPGPQGTRNTYHVRVRSSNLKSGDPTTNLQNPDLLGHGLTSGVYQLQLRLQETDEIAGSTVRYGDIRYAANGLTVRGQPTHSPLLGEAAEIEAQGGAANNTIGSAQNLGNVLNTDRAASSIAGFVSGPGDVDWYRLVVNYDNLEFDTRTLLGATFDVDYADGMARPDTFLAIFNAEGRLIYVSDDSNVADDRPGPLEGSDVDDLTRGSVGAFDPYAGTINLIEGTYFVAISSIAQIPQQLNQFTTRTPANPLLRLEPNNSVVRIVEDHIDYVGGSTAQPPLFGEMLDDNSPVPFNLGDLTLYVNFDNNTLFDRSTLVTVDPFTGQRETYVNNNSEFNFFPYDVGDIAFRSDQQIYAFSLDHEDPDGTSDAESGNLLRVSWVDGTATVIRDDDIETFQPDPADRTRAVRANGGAGYGVYFMGMTFTPPPMFQGERLVGIGFRPDDAFNNGVDVTRNIFYLFDNTANLGLAQPNPGAARPGGAWTDAQEIGRVSTGGEILAVEATTYLPTAPFTTTFNINDKDSFTINDGFQDNVFELEAGPEVRQDIIETLVNANPSRTIRDGNFFILDPDSSAELNAVPGALLTDGQQFQIRFDGTPVCVQPNPNLPPTTCSSPGLLTFEFDSNSVVAPGNNAIAFTAGSSVQQVAQSMFAAIQSAMNLAAGVARPDRTVTLQTSATFGRVTVGGPGFTYFQQTSPIVDLSGSTNDETLFQFDTGPVIVVNNTFGIVTQTLSVNGIIGITETYEFTDANVNDGNPLNANNIGIDVTGNITPVALAGFIADAINSGSTGVIAAAVGSRVTLIDEVTAYGSVLNSGAIEIEGDRGPASVLEAVPAGRIVDGAQFQLSFIGYPTYTFEFDKNGVLSSPTAVRVNLLGAVTAQDVAIRMQNAIGTSNAPATAQLVLSAGYGRVVVNGPQMTYFTASSPIIDLTSILPTLQIDVEENMTNIQVGAAVQNRVNNFTNFTASADGARINFPPRKIVPPIGFANKIAAESGDFRGVPRWTETNSRFGVTTGNFSVPFWAADSGADLAVQMAGAINVSNIPGISAGARGSNVVIDGILNGTVTATPPLNAQGSGPGGYITGMASVGNQLYAVSDQGGLYRLNPTIPIPANAYVEPPYLRSIPTTYITNSANDLLGIEFAGLTAGPASVENGRYANMLFGVDRHGRLYAFDTNGVLQPVFVDGQTSVDTGISQLGSFDDPNNHPVGSRHLWGVQGLAFGPLQTNLWNETASRGGTPADPQQGHGVNATYDESRFGSLDPLTPCVPNLDPYPECGNFSYHFGTGQGGTYNFPGGAYGTLVTNEFGLKGYAAADAPTLYFNYFSANENAEGGDNYDSFRVFIAGNNGNWTPLQINDESRGGAIFDNTNNWRQVRVSLAGFAGQENLRLRFEFSTAGDINSGDTNTTGDELRAVAAEFIRDGQTFRIDNETFEFEMGYTVVPPSGAAIIDGETLTISDGVGQPVTYEFDNNSVLNNPNNVRIRLDAGQTAADMARLIAQSVSITGPVNVTPHVIDNRVNLSGATSIQQGLAPGQTQLALVLEGNFGVTPTFTPVFINSSLDRNGVADAVDAAIEPVFHPQTIIVQSGLNYDDGDTFQFDDGLNLVNFELDSGYVASFPNANAIADGDTIKFYNNTFNAITLEFDSNNASTVGNIRVAFTAGMTRLALAQAIRSAILNSVAGNPNIAVLGLQNPRVLSNSRVQFGGVAGVYVKSSNAAITFLGTPGVGDSLTLRIPGALGIQVPGVGGSLLADGETFVITDGVISRTFELDSNGLLNNALAQSVMFTASSTSTQVANSIRTAVLSAGLSLIPSVLPNGLVDLNTNSTYTVTVANTTTLSLVGINGSVLDGERFTIGDGTVSYTIEFDNDGNLLPGSIPVLFTATTDPDTIAASVVTAVLSTGLPIVSPAQSPLGVVTLGETNALVFTENLTRVQLTGAPGDAVVAVPFSPSQTFDASAMGRAFATALNASPLNVFATPNPVANRRVALTGSELTLKQYGTARPFLVDPPISFEIPVDIVKQDDDLIRIIGHVVNDQGPLGLENNLAFDILSDIDIPPLRRGFNNIRRAQNNAFEGVYIDDLIIGFAERGEMATGANTNTTYIPTGASQPPNILEGPYQLEIRRSAEFGNVSRSFDTNARHSSSVVLIAQAGSRIVDGQTFVLSDGIRSVTFEYDDLSILADNPAFGTEPGNVAVGFNPSDPDHVVAANVRDAINSPAVQSTLSGVVAALSDGVDGVVNTAASTSSRINLTGQVSLDVHGVDVPESNDTLANATATGIVGISSKNYRASGQIGDNPDYPLQRGQDVDLFQLFLNAGETITVDVDASEIGSTLNSVLAVFNANGTAVAFNNNARGPGELVSADSFLTYTATIAGFYYVGVSGFNGIPVVAPFSVYNPTIEGSNAESFTTGFYELEITFGDPGRADFTYYNEVGDQNRFRDQGQILVYGNRVSNSQSWGILIDSGVRDLGGNAPHGGPVRQLRELNTANLAPGVVLMNNLVVSNGTGGIRFSGDPNLVGADGPLPFGRIVNNTVFGTGGDFFPGGVPGDVGIQVDQNASPTLLNNIVANFGTGLSVDATSATTVVGGMLYQGNQTDTAGVPTQDFPIFLANTDPLFVDPARGNFYPAAGSRTIDSSIDSLLERPELETVRAPLGIPSSPILAPDRDLYGLLRVDDSQAQPPSGFGGNVFKDRGAIDRADFTGPAAGLINPKDEIFTGAAPATSTPTDRNGAESIVQLPNIPVFDFSIQLVDGVEPADPVNGIGVDDTTVGANKVVLIRDTELLDNGLDYSYSYDATNNIIHLTPLAGLWELDRVYYISLVNRDQFSFVAPTGDQLTEGQTFTVGDSVTTTTFEFDSGYVLQVPTTGVADTQRFSITNGANPAVTFEFDRNSSITVGNVRVPFTQTSTPSDIATAIATAVNGVAGLGLAARNIGGGQVYLGGTTAHVVNVTQSSLTVSGTPGAQTAGATPIVFIPGFVPPSTTIPQMTAEAVATTIVNAIQNAGLVNVRASTLGYTQNGVNTVEVIVRGADSVTGFSTTFTEAIKDRAGNDLKANQITGETIFTIFLGNGVDFGDAPATYGTTGATPASHPVIVGYQLGANLDAEPSGQPSGVSPISMQANDLHSSDAALGDDLSGVTDDEDGVAFSDYFSGNTNIGLVYQGGTGRVTVTTAQTGTAIGQPTGFLDAFFDFNRDGDFDDVTDRVFSSRQLVAGPNILTFNVPSSAMLGPSFARFRFSSSGGLGPTGAAVDGEVEDYAVQIAGPPWQNTPSPMDVNNDGHISPIDVLLIINFLNSYPFVSALPNPPPFTPPGGTPIYPDNAGTGQDLFIDVTGDNFVSPIDALTIINLLNAGGGGEGEADVDPVSISSTGAMNLASPVTSTTSTTSTMGTTAEFVFEVGAPLESDALSSSAPMETARLVALAQFGQVGNEANVQVADELAAMIGDSDDDRRDQGREQFAALDSLFAGWDL